MRSGPLIALVLSAACHGQVTPAAPAHPPPSAPADPAPRVDSLKLLAPRDRPVVSQRAVRCLRLPDGTIADTAPYYQMLSAIRADAHKASRGVDRRAGPFVERITTETWWEMDDNGPAALGWGLRLPRFKDPAVRRSGRSGPDALEWPAGGVYQPRIPVCFIDAENPDPVTRSRAVPGIAEVSARLDGGIVEVILRHPDEPMDRTVLVKVPDESVASRGYLSGKFILWPDPSIPNPRAGGTPFPDRAAYWQECGPRRYTLAPETILSLRGTAGAVGLANAECVHRYIPASAMTVSASELAGALLNDETRLYDWSLQIKGGKGVWTQKRLVVSPAVRPAEAPPP
jgi:hypothetical protein